MSWSTSELRVRLAQWNWFKLSSKIFYWPFKGGISFVDLLCIFCLVFAMLLCASIYMCLVVTCWERDDLLALVFSVFLWVCHFPIGILGLASLAMSTSFLEALPGKLDIKRHLPSIVYISASLVMSTRIIELSKGAKIRNWYNKVPHLIQDTNGKVTNSQLDTINECQEASSLPAGDYKAHINRRIQMHSKHKTEKT